MEQRPLKSDPLTASVVRAALENEGLDIAGRVLAETGSTNDDCKRLLLGGETPPFYVLADFQRAGRGRGAHSFHSPAGSGLYCSFALALPDENSLPLVTPLAAAAVLTVVEKMTGLRLGIKWVNDLYYNGKKVCGILAERVQNGVVLGFGLNVHEADFPPDLADIAGTLSSDVPRAALFAAIAKEFFALYQNLPDDGFMSVYRERSILLGKSVHYIRNGVRVDARPVGIDARGGLIVERADGGLETLSSGEVSVRL